MDILFLAHRIPYPPNKGDKLRAFHELSALAGQHRVVCACFVDDRADWKHVSALRQHCGEVVAVPLRPSMARLRGLWSQTRGGTVTEGFYRSGAMHRALKALLASRSFDAVVAFSSSMAGHALSVPAQRRVLDFCDLDSQKWLAYAERARWPMRRLYEIEGRRLACCERAWLKSFDACLVISRAEARGSWLEGSGDSSAAGAENLPANLHVVGNGVDLPPPVRNLEHREHGCTVGFVGQMDYWPNVDAVCWFVERVWPGVMAVDPAARFRIVGRAPTDAVLRLSRHPGVEVVGEVEDVLAEVASFDVSVAPLRIARGLQNKVLEAMACERPVVLTKAAASGLDGLDGQHFVVSDSATALATHLAVLLRDAAARKRLGVQARAFVERHHDWSREMGKFLRIVSAPGPDSHHQRQNAGHDEHVADQPAALGAAGQIATGR